ncbi:hypothetical protein I553_5834 [Mycobacterium xenopi 4042]|uniref:Uncharacterized protein n=1 Tax=Mycobacterium xenopi 4042 TaxID=1299334 RepID=X7ZV30_MYCXE|nr:hypothetical protein I553_5834 [Mycobacterium xenopi 4042]
MNPMWHFAANFWWLVFPLGGAIGGACGRSPRPMNAGPNDGWNGTA